MAKSGVKILQYMPIPVIMLKIQLICKIQWPKSELWERLINCDHDMETYLLPVVPKCRNKCFFLKTIHYEVHLLLYSKRSSVTHS